VNTLFAWLFRLAGRPRRHPGTPEDRPFSIPTGECARARTLQVHRRPSDIVHAGLARHVALFCLALLAVRLLGHDPDRYRYAVSNGSARQPASPRGPPHDERK
jgi:hypothetical protein